MTGKAKARPASGSGRGRRGDAARPAAAAPAKAPGAIQEHLAAGLARHRSGDAAGAAAHYRDVLRRDAANADALHLLGVLHHQLGDHATAAELLRRAAGSAPHNAEIRSNLGAALFSAGDTAGAVESFRAAVTIRPDYVDGHANLAAAHVRLGQIDEAIASFADAHRLDPGVPRYLKRLGELCLDRGRLTEAMDWFATYLGLQPDDAGILNNAAFCCERLGRLAEAEAWYRRALALSPASPEIANNLGNVLRRLGRDDEAAGLFAQALAAPPDAWEDPAHRAGALFNSGALDEAIAIYDALCVRRPRDARLHADYARALNAAGRYGAAAVAYEIAIDADPRLDGVRVPLSHCLVRDQRPNEAIAVLEAVPATHPDYLRARIDLCYMLSGTGRQAEACGVARSIPDIPGYEPGFFMRPYAVLREACDFDGIDRIAIAPEAIADANLRSSAPNFLELLPWAETEAQVDALAGLHRRWGEAVSRAAEADPLPAPAVARSGGPIRLGFISSDLRGHSVARFVLPLFEHYDRERFEIVCYAPREEPDDAIQARIRDRVGGFRVVGGLDDRSLGLALRDDAIDILFELNGLTAESRLSALVWRPAPVQIYWLGYPFTTGIAAIDYVLVDPHFAAEQPAWLVETMLPLPGSWVSYEPFEAQPVAPEPPVVRDGRITFGTLNSPYKFTRRAVGLWAAAMRRVPGSRFLFVNPRFSGGPVADNIAHAFAAEGIARERLRFYDNRAEGRSHFACYADIDVALDTWPLTGGTTTADALWMGVPVVSRRGPSLHQRLSHSMLMNVGLDDLSCADDAAFVDTAVRLAADVDRLSSLRQGLRAMVRASTLGDPKRYADGFCRLMADVAARHGLR